MGAVDFLPHYAYADCKDWEGKWELYNGYPISMSPAPSKARIDFAKVFKHFRK